MARRVFFSFHHSGDSKRIGVVRNNGMCKPNIEAAGYIDSADWEQLKLQGKEAVQRWINDQLIGTSITVVLIGSETSKREWVNYEIKQSFDKGNALLGVYIHGIKGLDQQTTAQGANPFGNFVVESTNTSLSAIVKTYDWLNDNGYESFSTWIEEAVSSWQKPSGNVKEIEPSSSFTPTQNVRVRTPGQWGY